MNSRRAPRFVGASGSASHQMRDVGASPRGWLLTALAFTLAFAALGVVVMPGPTPLDVRIAQTVAPVASTGLEGPTGLGRLLEALNGVGQPLVWTPLVVVGALALLVVGRRTVAVMLVLGLGSEIVVAVAKAAFDRPRPVPPIVDLLQSLEQGSYPSGHVVRVAITAGVIALFLVPRRARPLAVVVGGAATLLMAIARISSLQHWATDAIGGAALAMAYLALLAAAAARGNRAAAGLSSTDARTR